MPLSSAKKLLLFNRNYSKRLLSIFGASSVVDYRPLQELSGGFAYDFGPKAHAPAPAVGVDWGGAGVAGGVAPYFDGVNDYINLQSAGLAADFNGVEGTASIWAQVAALGAWTDSALRRIFSISTTTACGMSLFKSTAAGRMDCNYTLSGGTATRVTTGLGALGGMMNWVFTWSAALGLCRVYLNNVQQGADLPNPAGSFTGSVSLALLGATSTVPAGVWSGGEAQFMLLNRAASASDIAAAYQAAF